MESVAALAELQELPAGSRMFCSGLVLSCLVQICRLVSVRKNQEPKEVVFFTTGQATVLHKKCLHQYNTDFPQPAVEPF